MKLPQEGSVCESGLWVDADAVKFTGSEPTHGVQFVAPGAEVTAMHLRLATSYLDSLRKHVPARAGTARAKRLAELGMTEDGR